MDIKLKVGLIDDEMNMLESLKDFINQFGDFELGFATIDPLEGLKRAARQEVDILITDVMMPKMGGLEITERLIGSGLPIIFCSAYDRYALTGYQLDAIYFIRKPVEYKELSRGLRKAKDYLQRLSNSQIGSAGDNRIVNSSGGVSGEVIQVSDIYYLKQSGNYTDIFFEKEKKAIVSSLSTTLIKLGDSGIVRIHKSFAVNIKKVKKFNYTEVELIDKRKVPLGRSYKDGLADYLSYKKL